MDGEPDHLVLRPAVPLVDFAQDPEQPVRAEFGIFEGLVGEGEESIPLSGHHVHRGHRFPNHRVPVGHRIVCAKVEQRGRLEVQMTGIHPHAALPGVCRQTADGDRGTLVVVPWEGQEAEAGERHGCNLSRGRRRRRSECIGARYRALADAKTVTKSPVPVKVRRTRARADRAGIGGMGGMAPLAAWRDTPPGAIRPLLLTSDLSAPV